MEIFEWVFGRLSFIIYSKSKRRRREKNCYIVCAQMWIFDVIFCVVVAFQVRKLCAQFRWSVSRLHISTKWHCRHKISLQIGTTFRSISCEQCCNKQTENDSMKFCNSFAPGMSRWGNGKHNPFDEEANSARLTDLHCIVCQGSHGMSHGKNPLCSLPLFIHFLGVGGVHFKSFRNFRDVFKHSCSCRRCIKASRNPTAISIVLHT